MEGKIDKNIEDKTCWCGRDSNGSEYGSVTVLSEHGYGLRSP